MMGGLGNDEQANKEIHDICDQLKTEVQEKIKKKFDKFVAVSFKQQCVAGTNFFIKVDVGNDGYLHLRVFKPLPHTGGKPSLSGVQEGKRHDDEIIHF